MGAEVNQYCESMASLRTSWADDVLPVKERQALERHLAECPACRVLAEQERAVRRLVHTRAASLRERAPAALRDRLTSNPARTSRIAPRQAAVWQRPLAASFLLALLGAGAYGVLAPSGTALAAQLALDHVKCRFLAQHDERGVTPQALEERWQRERGWAIHVPPGDSASGLDLAGLRHCLFSGGSMAHVIYHYRGQQLSLFVLPEPRQAAAALEIMGYDTVTWSSAGHTMALVGAIPRAELQAIATTLQQAH